MSIPKKGYKGKYISKKQLQEKRGKNRIRTQILDRTGKIKKIIPVRKD